MTLTRLHITARLVAIIMAVVSVANTKAQEIYRVESAPAAVQLRTNGLYDLVLCPNVGIEVQTDLGLAFQLDYVGAWWNSQKNNRYFSNYALQTELRYYFASPKMDFPYTGHHAGAYFQMATYDFEFGGKGFQCRDLDNSIGFGLSYGYSKAISRRFSLDFTLGIGYFTSKYTVYEPSNDWYKTTARKKLTWFGPTKAEVTLVWNLNKNNKR